MGGSLTDVSNGFSGTFKIDGGDEPVPQPPQSRSRQMRMDEDDGDEEDDGHGRDATESSSSSSSDSSSHSDGGDDARGSSQPLSYHPVQCASCGTEIGVYDKHEVYHFFNVVASVG